jgi:hypothetical protein
MCEWRFVWTDHFSWLTRRITLSEMFASAFRAICHPGCAWKNSQLTRERERERWGLNNLICPSLHAIIKTCNMKILSPLHFMRHCMLLGIISLSIAHGFGIFRKMKWAALNGLAQSDDELTVVFLRRRAVNSTFAKVSSSLCFCAYANRVPRINTHSCCACASISVSWYGRVCV